jgi:TRAP-type C4-dicarboxylate transport system permease large subunit
VADRQGHHIGFGQLYVCRGLRFGLRIHMIRTRIPMNLAEAIFSMTTNPMLILLLLNVFLFVAGCFMSTMNPSTFYPYIYAPSLQAGIEQWYLA